MPQSHYYVASPPPVVLPPALDGAPPLHCHSSAMNKSPLLDVGKRDGAIALPALQRLLQLAYSDHDTDKQLEVKADGGSASTLLPTCRLPICTVHAVPRHREEQSTAHHSDRRSRVCHCDKFIVSPARDYVQSTPVNIKSSSVLRRERWTNEQKRGVFCGRRLAATPAMRAKVTEPASLAVGVSRILCRSKSHPIRECHDLISRAFAPLHVLQHCDALRRL